MIAAGYQPATIHLLFDRFQIVWNERIRTAKWSACAQIHSFDTEQSNVMHLKAKEVKKCPKADW